MERVFPDPVLSSFDLPLGQTIYPFGYPLRLQTNSTDVIDAAIEGWGACVQMFDEPPVMMRLGVLPGSSEVIPMESVIRSQEHLMSIVADAENFLLCDFHQGFAFGWVNEQTASDHPLLRYRFLLAGAATLVGQKALAPMHGALVVRKGTGVMLTGESFAGKSTLAYACARKGWTYVSDDGAHLVRSRPDCYAVGDPHSIRFRPDARELFPELADCLPMVRPNGKIAIELRTSDLRLRTAPGCLIDHVVYLNRKAVARPRLRSLTAERVREDCMQYNVLGTAEVRDANRRCYERMLSASLWEMSYSDLDDAVARLEELVDCGA